MHAPPVANPPAEVIVKDVRSDSVVVDGDIVAFTLTEERMFLVLDTGYRFSIFLASSKFQEAITKMVSEEAIKRLQE